MFSQASAPLPVEESDPLAVVLCPMCHTPSPLSYGAIAAGGDWRCTRCAQHWDGERLAAVAAYAAWVVDQDTRKLQRSEGEAGKRP